eukprot:1179824-Prorocentrum_minimum.AAC.1
MSVRLQQQARSGGAFYGSGGAFYGSGGEFYGSGGEFYGSGGEFFGSQVPQEYSIITRLVEALEALGWTDFLETDSDSGDLQPKMDRIIIGGHSQVGLRAAIKPLVRPYTTEEFEILPPVIIGGGTRR